LLPRGQPAVPSGAIVRRDRARLTPEPAARAGPQPPGPALAIDRARAGRAGAARPGGRGTAFRRPLRAGDEPRAHARQPDAALGPAGPGARPIRAARPRL